MQNIEYFKKRFYLVYDFILEKHGLVFLIEETKKVFDKAYDKKDNKVLKKIDKEIDVWLREMFQPLEKKELLKILEKELNDNNDKDFLEQIGKNSK